MRAVLFAALAIGVAACTPQFDPKAPIDEDLDVPTHSEGSAALANVAAPAVPARAEAPPGIGVRSGTITRAQLLAVLDGGPGAFLRQLEVTPRLDGQRFVGWQLVQLLDRESPLARVDVVPGDVLIAVNGKPVAQPDQLQAIWDSLRTANALQADLWRGSAKVSLAFAIAP